MNKDILLWSNIEIMNALDKWGVLTLRNLQKQICSDISINGLRRKVHKLALEDYVQISRLDIKNELIILPTKKTLNQLKSNRSQTDETMVYHNLFISLLGTELITRDLVHFYNLPHEYKNSRIPSQFDPSILPDFRLEPDAYLGVNHNDKIFKVAIEVELTQKSSDRLYEKFNQYKDSSYFDYVIYFFKNKAILNAYRKRFSEMLMGLKNDKEFNNLTGKFIFLYTNQNHQYGSILNNCTMECHGRELSIEKFFGSGVTILDLKQ